MENSTSSKGRMAGYLRLLNEYEAGNLDNLECPTCRHRAVSVWFTNPAKDFYRTWFLCTDCNFHTRAQNSGKPQHFSEERRRMDLEERDAAILNVAVVKMPF